MSIRTHLILMTIFEFGGFLVGAISAFALIISGLVNHSMWMMGITLGGGVFIGVVLPRVIFRILISARCPIEGCRGSSKPKGSRPIKYVCSVCGHEHNTGVEENTSSPTHTRF